jgi:hypothetical protein
LHGGVSLELMHIRTAFRTSLLVILVSVLVCPRTYGLVSIDDGKNRIYVNASITYAWDSNIFANRDSTGDSIYSASVGLDFRRHAGLIAVNGGVAVDASTFGENTDENFQNPRFNIELNKQSGRTTGAITASAARQSRADSAANLRTESWSYEAGVNFKYPIIERYSISGGLGYALRDFKDNSILVDLSTYTANLDLFYVYTTERDLIATYRVRYGETSADTAYYDHAFMLGISGKILPKLGGTVRVGYQFHEPTNLASGEATSALTATGSAQWAVNKKMNAAVSISKDFSTTSTNVIVDSSSINLSMQYAFNSRVTATGGLGYGLNDFLGAVGDGRKDQYFTWNAGLSASMIGGRLTVSLGYTYYQNWSTVSFSNFERNSVNLSANTQF